LVCEEGKTMTIIKRLAAWQKTVVLVAVVIIGTTVPTALAFQTKGQTKGVGHSVVTVKTASASDTKAQAFTTALNTYQPVTSTATTPTIAKIPITTVDGDLLDIRFNAQSICTIGVLTANSFCSVQIQVDGVPVAPDPALVSATDPGQFQWDTPQVASTANGNARSIEGWVSPDGGDHTVQVFADAQGGATLTLNDWTLVVERSN